MFEHALGLGAFVLAAVSFIISLKQRRTLVPIFENEPRIREAPFIRDSLAPFRGLLGPWQRGGYYSVVLATISIMPAYLLEREKARFDPFVSKADFMQYFSREDVRRARVFAALGLTFLMTITLGYFL